MIALVVAGTATQWMSRIGKMLVLVAGLVVVLDLIGPDRAKRWADKAADRRDERADDVKLLETARPLQNLARDVAMCAARGDESFAHKWFSAEQFAVFKHEAWTSIRADRSYINAGLRSPRYIFPFFEDEAYEFLIKQLPNPEGDLLARVRDRFLNRVRRTQRIRMALLGSIFPFTIGLGYWLSTGGVPQVLGFFVAFIVVGVVVLSASAALVTPRVLGVLLLAEAAGWLKLTRAGLWLVGGDGSAWRLRAIALALLVVGSVLDLVGGW
jgi:hypothetical protein